MDLKRYLCVDAENIQVINYIFADYELYNDGDDYSKPRVISYGGESSVRIFEQNGIPKEYQKVFMIYNSFSMGLVELKNNRNNLRVTRFNRFKAKGYFTSTPIYLAINSSNVIFGQMADKNPRFDITNCYESTKGEINQFIIEIRAKGLFDNYLKSISEVLQLNIRWCIDSNKKTKIKSK